MVLSVWFVDFVIVELMGAVAVAPASGREGIIAPHRASPGKDHNSKFEAWFVLNTYCFYTSQSQKNLSQTIVSQGPSVYISIQVFICKNT